MRAHQFLLSIFLALFGGAFGQLAHAENNTMAINQRCSDEASARGLHSYFDDAARQAFRKKCKAYYAAHGLPSSQQGVSASPQEPPQAPSQSSAPVTATLRNSGSNCSDITGTGGGPGPSNCAQTNGVPPNVQAQINQAKPGQYTANPGSAASNAALLAEFNRTRAAALAARDAGDMLAAAADWAAASAARDKLHAAGQAICPPLAPESYWKDLDTETAKYCGTANCVERESARYGMTCFPDTQPRRHPLPELAKRREICADALAQLKPRAPNREWLAEHMANGEVPCHPDGTPFTLPEIKRGKVDGSLPNAGAIGSLID